MRADGNILVNFKGIQDTSLASEAIFFRKYRRSCEEVHHLFFLYIAVKITMALKVRLLQCMKF